VKEQRGIRCGASAPALGLDEVFRDHIAKRSDASASTLERRYEERFQIPAGAGLLCLLVDGLVGDRKVPPRRRAIVAAGGARCGAVRPRAPAAGKSVPESGAILLLVLLTPVVADSLILPADRAAEGNRLLRRPGNYAEAGAKYGEGMDGQPGLALLRFNLGGRPLQAGEVRGGRNRMGEAAGRRVIRTGSDPLRKTSATYSNRLGANGREGPIRKPHSPAMSRLLPSNKRADGADPT